MCIYLVNNMPSGVFPLLAAKLLLAYNLKPSYNQSLFKLTISDQELTKLNYFIHKYVHFTGQKLSGVLEQLPFTRKFLGKK